MVMVVVMTMMMTRGNPRDRFNFLPIMTQQDAHGDGGGDDCTEDDDGGGDGDGVGDADDGVGDDVRPT